VFARVRDGEAAQTGGQGNTEGKEKENLAESNLSARSVLTTRKALLRPELGKKSGTKCSEWGTLELGTSNKLSFCRDLKGDAKRKETLLLTIESLFSATLPPTELIDNLEEGLQNAMS